MLEFKGTKGEWIFSSGDCYPEISQWTQSEGRTRVFSASFHINDDISGKFKADSLCDENIANAKLIAAAPDLLEAVQSLLKWSAHFPVAMNENILIAKNAINKALGEEEVTNV